MVQNGLYDDFDALDFQDPDLLAGRITPSVWLLRALHTCPERLTRPLPAMLLISSVTSPVVPSTRSALVAE